MAKKAKRRKTSSRRKKRRVSGNQSFAPTVISGTRGKHGKSKKRRRKKVSGLTGSDTGDLLLGGIIGVGIGVLVDRFNPMDARIGDGVKILGGAALALNSKDKMYQGVGLGLAANGVSTGVHNFGLVHGLDDMLHGLGISTPNGKDTMLIEMNGVDVNSTKFNGTSEDQPKIVSGDQQSPMNGNGMPSIVSGY